MLIGAANSVWLARDTRPPTWDPAVHLTSSVRYRHVLEDFVGGAAPLREALDRLFRVDAYYPPLAPFATALITMGAAPDPDTSTEVLNQLSLALLMLGTYRLGRRFGNRGQAVAAAVAVTSFGGVWQASLAFMLDLPLAAVTALALDGLFGTQRFGSLRRSAVFGLICGLGMLTKWTFVFFLAVPFSAELVSGLAASPGRGRKLGHAILALALWAAIPLPWYLFHAPNLAREFLAFGFRPEGFPPVASWASLAFYPRALANLLLLPWLCVLVASCFLVLRRRTDLTRFAMLSIAGLACLVLIRNKNDRYALPLLPSTAIVATAWIGRSGWSPRLRTGIVAAAAAASLTLALRQDPPVSQPWPIAETLAAALAPPSPARPCVRVVPDHPLFQRFLFEYTAEAGRRSADIEGGSGFPTFTDAVVIKTGEPGDRADAREIMAAIASDEGGFHEVFQKTWEHALPDGSRVEVYRRQIRPITGVSAETLIERLQAAIRKEISEELGAPFSGRVEVVPISEEETLRGHFRRLTAEGRDVRVGGAERGSALVLREVFGALSDVTVNPYRARDGDLELLSVGEVAPRVVLRDNDVNTWLVARGAAGARVSFRGGAVRASFARGPWPAFDLALVPELVREENLRFRFTAFRLGGIRLPALLLSLPASGYNPLLKEMPCRIRLASVYCENGTLVIRGDSGERPRSPAEEVTISRSSQEVR